MLSSRLNAFVIPTSQTTATTTATTSFVNSSTRSPLRSRSRPRRTGQRASAAARGGGRRRRARRRRAACSRRRSRPARVSARPRRRRPRTRRPARRPAKMPTPPKSRRRSIVPALAGGNRDQPPPERRAQERPENEVRDGQSGDRDGRTHAHRVMGAAVVLPGRCAGRGAIHCAPMAVYADLIRYRELFASLFRRDLRAKYKGSVLGPRLDARAARCC